MKTLGFIVNPVAGMGGAIGLKGTDGDAYFEALSLGAKPVTPQRAEQFLSNIKSREELFILSAPSVMGEKMVEKAGFEYRVIGLTEDERKTSAEDTRRIVKDIMKEGIDLIVFVGGDGTSRDIYDVVGFDKPVLGVPSGVKMFGSVFAVNAKAAARVVDAFVRGNAEIVEKEVLDIDEEAFRKSKLNVKLYGYLRVPTVKDLVQSGKEPSRGGVSQRESKRAIAEYVLENMAQDVLFLLGPGTTTKAIADKLKVKKTLLGVDAVCDGKLIGQDLNERGIISLFSRFDKAKIVVSPIGGQGFIFGRGNQEFSPEVIREVGKKNLIVVATKGKMDELRRLRVDTGDSEVDEMLNGYMKVVTGYNEEVMIEVV